MTKVKPLLALATIGVAMSFSAPSFAQKADPSIARCLKAWGKHPFTANPKFRVIGATVKVFGIGANPADTETTSTPSLVLVNTGVNVLGGTTFELLNPNGWYCFRSNVNVMGSLRIRANCSAHLASAHDGTAVLGSDSDNKSVTVMGATKVELVGCQ
ncbi:MAG: hypothetical protein ABIR52_14075 [Casimicrobiaceae bacterium]